MPNGPSSDITLNFITDEDKFSTRKVQQELSDADRAFVTSQKAAGTWSTTVKRAADDAVPKTKGGRWKGAGQDLGGEFAQNIGEGISSGKLGIGGALDTVLGTLGGVLPALGPAGAVVGIGGLLIGSIVKGITDNAAEVAAATRQAVKDAVAAAADQLETEKPRRSIADIIKGFSPEDIENFDKAGVSVGRMASATQDLESGDPTAMNAITREIQGRAVSVKAVATSHDTLDAAPNPFEKGGPLAGDKATLDAIDKQTTALNGQAAALLSLSTELDRLDLNKLRQTQAAAGRPINGRVPGVRTP